MDSRGSEEGPEKPSQLKVCISHRAPVCGECREELGTKAWVFLAGERGAVCLSCADLDHLVFLPSGDAALTRRARKLSTLAAVVLEWSRARKRTARRLDDEAVRMAVVAHVRHHETAYDELLASGEERPDARARIRKNVEAVLERWRRPTPG